MVAMACAFCSGEEISERCCDSTEHNSAACAECKQAVALSLLSCLKYYCSINANADAWEGGACPLAKLGEIPGAKSGPGCVAVAVAAVWFLPSAEQVGHNPPVSDVLILQLLIVQRALPSVTAVLWLLPP